jgi:hypothetical protein
VKRAAGVVLATLALLAAIPAAAPAANAPGVESVEMYLQKSAHGYEHSLRLDVYPQRGMAVVDTAIRTAAGLERGRGVSYATAIPTTPFEGTLDLTFPGLGRIDGTVSTKKEGGPECHDGTSDATFAGHLDFRGSGGYESWKATRAEASVTHACDPRAPKAATPEALFSAVQEFGPGLSGGWFRFLGRSRNHLVNFIAMSDLYRGEGTVQFVAFDREWLPGEVIAQRWVDRPGLPAKGTVEIGPGGDHPATVVFRPPAPFFGTGRYDRRSHTLTGSLGVSFLGRRMRLANPPLVALLEDEVPQPAGRVG